MHMILSRVDSEALVTMRSVVCGDSAIPKDTTRGVWRMLQHSI